jgi:hypothetical protein
MEQVHEIDLNSISEPECAKVEICVECEEPQVEPEWESKVQIVPLKTRLSKLIKKSRYNKKYLEQVIPISRIERERVHRNYGIW